MGRVGTPLHRSRNLGRYVSFGPQVGTSSGLDETDQARRNVARARQQTRRESDPTGVARRGCRTLARGGARLEKFNLYTLTHYDDNGLFLSL
jgi:hypothetical protein